MRKTLEDFGTPPDLVVLQMAQRWEAVLMLIARQEMEHLAIVCNLLNAIGGDLNFDRPNFPQPAKRYPLHIPFRLDPFGVPALRRFVWFEKPEELIPTFSRDGYCPDYPPPAANNLLESMNVPETQYGSVQELYSKIAKAFQNLDSTQVFRGNTDRQVDGSQFAYRITVEPVTNREQAAAAIGLIIEQGEGIGLTPLDPNGSHFQMFVRILREFEDAKRAIPGFNPTLNVVENPVLEQGHGAGRGTVVTHQPSRVGMELFNEAYNLMLVMLRSWFQQFSFSQNYPRQAAQFYAAFFPLMTMVIRPLGEILTRMPAGVDGKNAGPSFELPHLLPDQEINREWYLRKLNELETKCRDFGECAPDGFKDRVTFIFQNIHATNLHFADMWAEAEKPMKVSHFPV
jgi:Ferritin-like